MRKSKLVVAIGAAVALAATPLLTATTAAAASGTNSGTAATSGVMVTGTSAACGGKQIGRPAGYPDGTKLVDLSGIADFTPVSSKNNVKFTPTLEKRSVPGSWATWGSPPDTESATPNILYTVGATSIKVTLPDRGARRAAGMEVEPNPFAEHTFTAVFAKKSGEEICTATVVANGEAGAKLLAAKVRRAKTITVSSDTDFSIAQVRYK